jgi:hypothetical protein
LATVAIEPRKYLEGDDDARLIEARVTLQSIQRHTKHTKAGRLVRLCDFQLKL